MIPIEMVVDRVAPRRVGTSRLHTFVAHRSGGAFPRILLPTGHPGAFGLGCLLLGTLSGSALADSSENSGSESREPLLRPTRVVSTSGNVTNADALVEDHEGYATLTMVQGSPAPQIILDYGRDVDGLPVFDVAAVSETPKLQAIYSEAQQYLLPDGDAAPGVPQDPKVAQPEVSFVGYAAARG
jgi:hypothetical protein